MPLQTGLPHATRSFELLFTLNGVPTAPTAIQGEFYRFVKGKKHVVQDLVNGDFTATATTGLYTITVQPDTYGEFFIRAWNTGDAKTDDGELSFIVPTPGAG